jgi:hypothetical protein
MTELPYPRNPSHLVKEPVQVLLRGGQVLTGELHIPDGMPLVNYLRVRRLFLNLTSVRRIGLDEEGDPYGHLSIRLSNIVWVIPLDPSLHVSSTLTPAESGRTVELQLVDNRNLTVTLNIADEQRMSDYLDSNSGFVPLFEAKIQPGDRMVERLAVNHEAILAIREVNRR